MDRVTDPKFDEIVDGYWDSVGHEWYGFYGLEAMQKAGGGPFIGPKGGKWADAAHKIPWDANKHHGKPAPTAKDHDEHHSREMQLVAENMPPLGQAQFHRASSEQMSSHQLHQQRHSIKANLVKKIAAGKYDHAQATKLWHYHAQAVDKHMGKHFGGGRADPATRMHAAQGMADDFHDEVTWGEHDDHEALKGVHKKRADAGGGLSKIAEGHKGPKQEEKKSMSTQDHLDQHDHHRGMESSHKHQAKKAIAIGETWNEAHHLKQAKEHGEKADHHAKQAEGKRFGGVKKSEDVDVLDLVRAPNVDFTAPFKVGSVTYQPTAPSELTHRSTKTGLPPEPKYLEVQMDLSPEDPNIKRFEDGTMASPHGNLMSVAAAGVEDDKRVVIINVDGDEAEE